MLNGGEIIVIGNKKYLFCGFEKQVIEKRSKNWDISYSTELVVLGRMMPQMKEKGLVALLGTDNASYISLNEDAKLDGRSKFVSKNKVGITIFSDVDVIGYMENYEQEVNLWSVKLSMSRNIETKKRTYYTSQETIELMHKSLRVFKERDKSVFAAFIRDFVKLYENTPYYDTVYAKYEKYFNVYDCFSFSFDTDSHHAVYAKDNMFYFIYRHSKNVCIHIILMEKFDEVLNEFAMRSGSIPTKDCMERKFGDMFKW